MLRRYGLPIDPRRVACGQFVRSKGQAAADEILDRGLELDAIVAANDGMALGILEALRKRGIGVPRDLAVTGFDDLDLARLAFPPLTTVAQPLTTMVELGVRLVVDQLDGRTVPLLTHLPAELIARLSCGCGQNVASSRRSPEQGWDAIALLRQSTPQILRQLAAGKLTVRAGASGDAARLLAALELELLGHGDSFLPAVQGITGEVGADNERYQDLQLLLTYLREQLREIFTAELEDSVARSTRYRRSGQHRQSGSAARADR